MVDQWSNWLDDDEPSDNASRPPPGVRAATALDIAHAVDEDEDGAAQERWEAINSTLWTNWMQYVSNRAVDEPAFGALVAVYAILIVTGAAGNGLVCLVVARKPHMRTARNVFVINLAVSDLLLCGLTMPFTLTEVLLKSWPLGEFMCKWVSALQATSIFVSTASITAIALDRYNVIVYNPTAQQWSERLGAVAVLGAVWGLAFVLALPLFVVRHLDRHHVGLPGLESVEFCFEKWPVMHGRAAYSVFSMLVQYVLPIGIVSVAYARICRQLRSRLSINSLRAPSRASAEQRRIARTNTLLVSIAAIFGVSWLPLNILNLVTDCVEPFQSDRDFRVAFACCHVLGMSSACSNPLLYGWLNDNFRKEFREVFATCYLCLAPSSLQSRTATARTSNGSQLPMMELTSTQQQQRRRSSGIVRGGGLAATLEETTVTTQGTSTVTSGQPQQPSAI